MVQLPPGPSGRVRITVAVAVMIAACTIRTVALSPQSQLEASVTSMTAMAVVLARRLIAPWRFRLSIKGPNCSQRVRVLRALYEA